MSSRLARQLWREPRRLLSTSAGKENDRTSDSLIEGLDFLIRFAGVAYCIQVYGFGTVLPAGPSMQPTLNPRGDVLFADYFSPRFHLNRGNIVLARKPTDPNVMIVKRVIGLPGDKIGDTIVPPGHVWLQGDNAAQSDDSRRYGPAPKALVCGRAWFRFWPPGQAGWLN